MRLISFLCKEEKYQGQSGQVVDLKKKVSIKEVEMIVFLVIEGFISIYF
jgi:hypothetical protein